MAHSITPLLWRGGGPGARVLRRTGELCGVECDRTQAAPSRTRTHAMATWWSRGARSGLAVIRRGDEETNAW